MNFYYLQIHIDIPRMSTPLFQQTTVQEMFERILFIWAIRHPASGYVQGMNDLVTPFYVVFLQEYLPIGTSISIIFVNFLKIIYLYIQINYYFKVPILKTLK